MKDGAAFLHDRHLHTAEYGRRGVVRVVFKLGGNSEQFLAVHSIVQQPVRGYEAANARHGTRSQPARERNLAFVARRNLR